MKMDKEHWRVKTAGPMWQREMKSVISGAARDKLGNFRVQFPHATHQLT